MHYKTEGKMHIWLKKNIKNEESKMYLNASIVVSDGMFWDIPALICGPLHMLFPSLVPLFVVKQQPKFLTPSEVQNFSG